MRDFCWCTDCEQVKTCGSEAVTSDEVRDAIKGKAKSEKVMSTKGHGRVRGRGRCRWEGVSWDAP